LYAAIRLQAPQHFTYCTIRSSLAGFAADDEKRSRFHTKITQPGAARQPFVDLMQREQMPALPR
jgi:hypothetical protein